MAKKYIVWFQMDLRLSDNPALVSAAKLGDVYPIFIFDDKLEASQPMGAASKWWLHHSLESLKESLRDNLSLFKGDPEKILKQLCVDHDVAGVFWNRVYEPAIIERNAKIKLCLEKQGVHAKSFNGSLLWEPWEVCKADGEHYKVFTPFYQKGCLAAPPPRRPLERLKKITAHQFDSSIALDKLGLLPKKSWHQKLEQYWDIGESGAQEKLKQFAQDDIVEYKEKRDFPIESGTSQLSPHIHFGEISSHQIWYYVKDKCDSKKSEPFLRQLVWREFSYHLLYHYPTLPEKNWRDQFDKFPWEKDQKLLTAWQKGQTGYPIVDAGMRQLWETGYMHNRVRMIVGSFLVKNGLTHWLAGAAWFWDCLVDADLANNSASWQWVAGTGADAAPYFRIFNPILQAQKFDGEGEYIRQFVPELAKLPTKHIFAPWEAPKAVLDEAGVKLGNDYPKPILNLKETRDRALSAFKQLKS